MTCEKADMELLAGAGGMFGQLAVGLATSPGEQPSAGNFNASSGKPFGFNMATKLAEAARQKYEFSGLPDKVRCSCCHQWIKNWN